MNSNNCIQIAEKWLEFFNAKDLESLLSLYSENAQHYSPRLKLKFPEGDGLIKGKAAMREWWSEAMKNIEGLHYQKKKIMADEEQAIIEYTRKADNAPDASIAEVLQIQNGKIVFSKVYIG